MTAVASGLQATSFQPHQCVPAKAASSRQALLLFGADLGTAVHLHFCYGALPELRLSHGEDIHLPPVPYNATLNTRAEGRLWPALGWLMSWLVLSVPLCSPRLYRESSSATWHLSGDEGWWGLVQYSGDSLPGESLWQPTKLSWNLFQVHIHKTHVCNLFIWSSTIGYDSLSPQLSHKISHTCPSLIIEHASYL
jgi:hypothetical protein